MFSRSCISNTENWSWAWCNEGVTIELEFQKWPSVHCFVQFFFVRLLKHMPSYLTRQKKLWPAPPQKWPRMGVQKLWLSCIPLESQKNDPPLSLSTPSKNQSLGGGFYILDKDQILVNLKGEGNLIFYCIGSWENFFWVGWSVQKIIIIIIILSFRVGISKNIDHQVKETCAIVLTQVTYETDYISLLSDSTVSSAANFCCLCILL